MIKFDFCEIESSLLNKKDEVMQQFNDSEMIGWTHKIDSSIISDILSARDEVKKHSSCLVVIGIGGSFLGSYALKQALDSYFSSSSFPIIYAGTSLSSQYMNELLDYLEDVDFSINVISKSGRTMEILITYNLIKDLMKKKYSDEELRKRIIITTDSYSGELREEIEKEKYTSFVIPNDIGGRYSVMTPAHLFPLSFNFDISKFIKGYYSGDKYIDDAYLYAVSRRNLFDKGKYIENFCIFENKLYYFTEWLKQLFGETEGKNGRGIFPVSTVYTRDLHSLGQFVQEGNKIIFETFIKVEESDKVLYNGKDLHYMNNIVLESVRDAHFMGDVFSNLITIKQINEETLGELMYFFMMSSAFSGFLFGVDPFNQPGVEVYKNKVRENLDF